MRMQATVSADSVNHAIRPGSPRASAEAALYGGVYSFLRRKFSQDFEHPEVDVVVTGVPFDLATTGRAGTRFGPAALRAASAHLGWEQARWPWGFRVFERLGVIDCGDVGFESGSPASMVDNLQAHARQVLAAGKILLTLGGDHFIALPLLREHARRFGALSLIHFDAHTDTYTQGGPYDHGTMFHQALREGVIDPQHSVQIGIRTEYDRAAHRFTALEADWVNDHGAAATSAAIRRVVGARPAYLSFDIDCLDPAYAPGTGTPVCGGLSSDLALKIVRGLVDVNLVGMDLVEVAPPYDHADITALAGATLALEFLYLLAARR
ncbi:MAG TPA: agmatinase [Candidatus Competibacteraceae bacterium]|nr:agmatinase [Candidatus Competibacteraceae bacterium]